MKKNKQPRKVARKQLTNKIKLSLADKMIEVMDNLGQGSKNLQKEIKKASGKLSKKIAKKIKINIASDMDLGNGQKTAHEQVGSENVVDQKKPSTKPFKKSVLKPGPKAAKRPTQEA